MNNLKFNISLIFIVIAFFIFSCNSTKKMSETNLDDKNMKTSPQKTAQSLNQTIVEPSFTLFKNLSDFQNEENISYSPISLNLAFGMIYSGAVNNTAKEISKTLCYNEDIKTFNKEFEKLFKTLKQLENDTLMQFAIANRIYFEQSFKIKEDYLKTVNSYGEENILQKADFQNNAPKEEEAINDWVFDFTNQRIDNLIPKSSLDKYTKMVLVSALYFKSDWKYQFNEYATKKNKFYSTKEQISDKYFMTQRFNNNIRYYKTKNTQVLELPYKTKNISLLIILPDNSNINNINSYIPKAEEYLNICKNLSNSFVYVELPKFKTESTFELSGYLQKMGIKTAFSNSDFSGISNDNTLKISAVLQKVFFELNETGTEAAAATAILMKTTSLHTNAQEPIQFIANRPFIYILKDNNLEIPLFIGKCVQ